MLKIKSLLLILIFIFSSANALKLENRCTCDVTLKFKLKSKNVKKLKSFYITIQQLSDMEINITPGEYQISALDKNDFNIFLPFRRLKFILTVGSVQLSNEKIAKLSESETISVSLVECMTYGFYGF